ncbi:MAG: hypothetical protein RLZZ435_2043 [Cyanobacteriota bacterium]
MITSPSPPILPFQNQEAAFQKVESSIGQLLVLDALPGYGKTAFLQKLEEEYHDRANWYCRHLRLQRERTDVDLMLDILEALGDTHFQTADPDQIQPMEALMAVRNRLRQWNRITTGNKAIALFLDDVHRLSSPALTWLRTQFCEELQGYLARATQQQFLLVVAGQNLRQAGSWPGHNYVYLTPFQRVTLRRVLDQAQLPQLTHHLNTQFNQAVYKTRELFTNRIYRLTGGHPSTSIKLVQALQRETWQPEEGGMLVNHIDFQAFETYVAQELAQLTQGLDRQHTRYFPTLLIFRMLNSSIVQAVRRKLGFKEANAPLKQMKSLTAHSLAIEESRTTYRLNPVLRQGQLAQLMLSQVPDHQQTYQDLHRFAQQVYQGLNLKTTDPGRIQDYLKESLYHCLCLYPEGRWTSLMQCLRQGLQAAAHLEEDFQEDPQDILGDLIRDDEDIQALLQEHNLLWERVVEGALELWHNRPWGRILASTGEATSPANYSFYRNCLQHLSLALVADQQILGTGFWVQFQQQPILITADHLLRAVNLTVGDRLVGRTFGLNSQELTLEILAYPQRGNAQIALLRPTEPTLVQWPAPFLDLQSAERSQLHPNGNHTGMSLYGFGFPRSNARGESLDPLVWDQTLDQGFLRLVNLGKTKLEQGLSGAPVVDLERGEIVAMVQAQPADLEHDREGVRCIPAPAILEALTEVKASIYSAQCLQHLKVERLNREITQLLAEREALMQRRSTTLDVVAEQRLGRHIEQLEFKIAQLEHERQTLSPEVDHG